MFALFIRDDGWTKQQWVDHEQPIMDFEDKLYQRYLIHTGSTYAPGPDRVEYREMKETRDE